MLYDDNSWWQTRIKLRWGPGVRSRVDFSKLEVGHLSKCSKLEFSGLLGYFWKKFLLRRRCIKNVQIRSIYPKSISLINILGTFSTVKLVTYRFWPNPSPWYSHTPSLDPWWQHIKYFHARSDKYLSNEQIRLLNHA